MRTIPLAVSLLSLTIGMARPVFAEGDIAVGERLFRSLCASCHRSESNWTGIKLTGIVGRQAGKYPGGTFSRALIESNITWDAQSLDEYLAFPDKKVPGGINPVSVADAKEREDIIAYLTSLR